MNGGTGSTTKTDLYSLHNYVQNTLIFYPKERIIEALREYFKEDSYYRYVQDQWGFPKTVDQTNKKPSDGIDNSLTTRINIGEANRFDIIYHPSIQVRHTGSRSVPIGFNRNQGVIQYRNVRYVDGYGNESYVLYPDHYVVAGAWEGSLSLEIRAENPRTRDELTELVAIHFVNTIHNELILSGIIIKDVSAGTGSEEEDGNRKIFKNTVTLEIRSEWRQKIPINSLIDAINICAEIGNLTEDPPALAPNLSIQTTIELTNELLNL